MKPVPTHVQLLAKGKTVLKIVAFNVKKPQKIGNAMQSLADNFESNKEEEIS